MRGGCQQLVLRESFTRDQVFVPQDEEYLASLLPIPLVDIQHLDASLLDPGRQYRYRLGPGCVPACASEACAYRHDNRDAPDEAAARQLACLPHQSGLINLTAFFTLILE